MYFPCSKCGICCRMIVGIPALSEFDTGSGVCRYLKNNLCEIYEERPLICNIEKMFVAHFSQTMTEQEYLIKNITSCQQLMKMDVN